MMSRRGYVEDTSIDAFHKHVLPHRNRRQQEILDVFVENPYQKDWTNRELAKYLRWSVCSVTPRTNELRSMGLLIRGPKKICSVTMKKVWSSRLNTIQIKLM